MTSEQRASERITEEVTSWPGVTAGPGRRGEFAFKVGGRELGHLHGDHVAHFGFPEGGLARALRAGADRLSPGLPRQARLRRARIESEDDVHDVIALLRLNYDRVVARHGTPVEA